MGLRIFLKPSNKIPGNYNDTIFFFKTRRKTNSCIEMKERKGKRNFKNMNYYLLHAKEYEVCYITIPIDIPKADISLIRR